MSHFIASYTVSERVLYHDITIKMYYLSFCDKNAGLFKTDNSRTFTYRHLSIRGSLLGPKGTKIDTNCTSVVRPLSPPCPFNVCILGKGLVVLGS